MKTQIKELLLNLQPNNGGPAPSGDSTTRDLPPEDDVLSTTASFCLQLKGEESKTRRGTRSPRASDIFSQGYDGGPLCGSEAGRSSLKPVIRMVGAG